MERRCDKCEWCGSFGVHIFCCRFPPPHPEVQPGHSCGEFKKREGPLHWIQKDTTTRIREEVFDHAYTRGVSDGRKLEREDCVSLVEETGYERQTPYGTGLLSHGDYQKLIASSIRNREKMS
jgi:hypothetical protein